MGGNGLKFRVFTAFALFERELPLPPLHCAVSSLFCPCAGVFLALHEGSAAFSAFIKDFGAFLAPYGRFLHTARAFIAFLPLGKTFIAFLAPFRGFYRKSAANNTKNEVYYGF